jgi:hypothetical protein
VAVFLPDRHEHARHQRKVERHVALVAVAEIRPHVGGPLVRFRDQHPIGIALVHRRAKAAEHRMRLLEVLADRAFALDQIRHGVEAQPVHAAVQPELHRLRDGVEDARVVEVQIGLVMEEPVPVVRLRRIVPGPVRRLGVGEDDADALVFLVRLAPHVEVALGRPGRRAARGLEPRMLVGRVVDDELGDHADAARVRLADEAVEILERAVTRMDSLVIRDVVAVVAERRGIEGQHPEHVDPQRLQVVEAAREAGKVADAVAVAVGEGADVRLVDDGILVPERIGHRFNRGASPLGLPDTVARSARRRLAPLRWLASLRSLALIGASPFGLPDTVARSARHRLAPLRWLASLRSLALIGASPLGLPDTVARSARRRLAPLRWLASLRSLACWFRGNGHESKAGLITCATREGGSSRT